MSTQFSFGKGLLRTAVSLGFLGCLIAQGSLFGQAATSEPLTVTTEAMANASVETPGFGSNRCANLNNADIPAPGTVALDVDCSDSMLTNPLEIDVDDCGIAFEDSVEMLRVNIQQRTFGIDHVVIGSKVASTAAQNTRPNISPPLLV